jgi:hypothetical protein
VSLTRVNKTGQPQVIPASDGHLTISIPIQINRRSGRKLVTLPSDGTANRWPREPTPLQLALARGHRWLSMLESGQVKSLRELARKERVGCPCLQRISSNAAMFERCHPCMHNA